MHRRHFLLFSAALAGVLASPLADAAPTTAPPLTVFVVRHAEKAKGDDPPLLPVGAARAAALDRMLGDVVLQGIWSSDTQRTRDTAGPTATARDMPLKFYDPRDSDALVKRLKAAGGTHLVVGHSNTVPALVHALGGVKGPDLPETEYDRLMVVVVPETGPPAVQILRYGTPAH